MSEVPLVTLFSAPKPFQGHIDLIQRNALRSWLALGPQVEVLLVGDEPGLAEVAAEFGVAHLAGVARNAYGTPLVSDIFRLARQAARASLLCYLNADILLLEDFLPAVQRVQEAFARFLIVGQRWDLEVGEALDFGPEGRAALRARLAREGRLHPPAGSDYFVFPSGTFAGMPPFALGRAGWDNWMIYAARRMRLPVVDATQAVTVVHQNHDYGHLPGGRPHYNLPESQENVRLAGGRETVFTLRDATWRLTPQGLRRVARPGGSLKRWLEAGLYVSLGPGALSRLVRLTLNPAQGVAFLRQRLGAGGAAARRPEG